MSPQVRLDQAVRDNKRVVLGHACLGQHPGGEGAQLVDRHSIATCVVDVGVGAHLFTLSRRRR
jgi:hypothetical protein